ncbi:MAG: ATP-binding protein [Alphaproteobacteria bacterium]|nr:ATP-binding protein [Alphaproteobacteria bacterium]
MSSNEAAFLHVLTRIADALEQQKPQAATTPQTLNLHMADTWLWHGETRYLQPIARMSSVPLALLQGLEHIRNILHDNTAQFAKGLPANNALLWGARGMGKSSLVKAVFQDVYNMNPGILALIEVHRDEIATLPILISLIAKHPTKRFIIYCDDMSFEREDAAYKSLKTVLDGSIAGKPENIVIYATSNRRHLLPRDMSENQNRAIHVNEDTEEKVSLSDRFGLWLGFYSCDMDTYLKMVDGYARFFRLEPPANFHALAMEWAATRGGRSGRVAWQFITDIAGRQGKAVKLQ